MTDSLAKANAALSMAWRNDNNGRSVVLLFTPVGLDAIGVEREAFQESAALRTTAAELAEEPTPGVRLLWPQRRPTTPRAACRIGDRRPRGAAGTHL